MDIFCNADHINTIGLSLDVIGVILLFRFGLPQDISRDGNTGNNIIYSDPDPKEIEKAKLYDKLSYVALITIVLGFGLQIYSNYI